MCSNFLCRRYLLTHLFMDPFNKCLLMPAMGLCWAKDATVSRTKLIPHGTCILIGEVYKHCNPYSVILSLNKF